MKKTICVLLAVLLLASLCACGKTGDAKTPEEIIKPIITTTVNKPVETDPPVETEAVTETEEPVVETTEAPASVQPAEAPEVARFPAKWSLKEIGTVDNSDKNLYFYRGDVFRYERDSEGTMLLIATDHMGNPISEERYNDVCSLLPGVYEVTAIAEGINTTGILLEDGEMELPCEAAIIRTISETYNMDLESSRYLYVVYGTEVTTNKDEAFFYATTSMFSITPQEGDVYYKGYGMVYDLEAHRFVPDLKVTNPSSGSVKSAGNMIVCTNTDYSTTVYNSEGEIIADGDSIDAGNGFLLVDYKTVLDETGNKLFENDAYMQIIKGSGEYLVSNDYTSETQIVYDRFGGVLMEVSDDYSFYNDGGGYFLADADDYSCLLDAEGHEVHRVENSYSPDYCGCGVWEFIPEDSNANSVYYLANGKAVTGAQRYAHDLINEVENETSGVATFRFWNDPETDVDFKCSYTEKLGDALLYVHGDSSVLVDCFTGETLMTGDDFKLVNDKYLYVKTGNSYTVYQLELEY